MSGPRWARWASGAGAPAVLAAVVPLVVGASSGGWRGLGLAALGAVVAVGPGLALVLHLVRTGRVVGHHLPHRGDRPRVLGAALVGVVVAAGLVAALGAPRELVVLMTAMAVLLGVLAVASLRWKVSLHAATATASFVALVSALGPWALLGAPLVLLVCWSRLALSAHTRGQVVAGGLAGLVAGVLALGLTG